MKYLIDLISRILRPRSILVLAALASSMAFGQQAPKDTGSVIRKVHVRHADPMHIAKIISGKGTILDSPEISTLLKTFNWR